jgi:release factor glutamine methyltransferase
MLYEPAEDSFLLQKYVRKYAKGKVLDLGAGTGILAKTALEKTKDVLAADINEEAVKKCKILGIKAVKSDLFSNIKEKFDLIIFNPPYLPDDKFNLEDNLNHIGGKKRNEVIERFFSKVREHLNKNGKVLIVFSSLTPNVEKIITRYCFKYKKLSEKNFFFEKLFVYLVF